MTQDDRFAAIEAAMKEAAARQDFEAAAALRNRLIVARQTGHDPGDVDADFAGVGRQRPGAMGIGSQVPRREPPPGWKPPPKPDAMTTNRKRGGRH